MEADRHRRPSELLYGLGHTDSLPQLLLQLQHQGTPHRTFLAMQHEQTSGKVQLHEDPLPL